MSTGIAVAVVPAMTFVAAAGVWWAVGTVNALERRRNLVHESGRQLNVELRRRRELIPQLLGTIVAGGPEDRGAPDGPDGPDGSGGPGDESGPPDRLNEVVTRVRVAGVGALPGPEVVGSSRWQGERELTEALAALFDVVSGDRVLCAREDFAALHQELTETGERIAAAERLHNAHVVGFNARIGAFPVSLVAAAVRLRRAVRFAPSEGRSLAHQCPPVARRGMPGGHRDQGPAGVPDSDSATGRPTQ